MTKNIYYKGFIYEGVDDSKVQAISLLPRFELIGSHSFVDMQEVVEGKDYEKFFQGWNFIERKWERVISTEYDSLLDLARRIIALPLPTTPVPDKEEGRGKDNSLYATGDILNVNLEVTYAPYGSVDDLPGTVG